MHACANCFLKLSVVLRAMHFFPYLSHYKPLVISISLWLCPVSDSTLLLISIDVYNDRPLPGIFFFSRELVLVTDRDKLFSVWDLSLTVREALHLTPSRVSIGREMKLKHPGDHFYFR